MTALLQARGLTKRFKGLVANEDVDFDLKEGQVQCLIGPNGAGKTTFLSMLSGHLIPTSGTVMFGGSGRDPAVGGRTRAQGHRPQVSDAHGV